MNEHPWSLITPFILYLTVFHCPSDFSSEYGVSYESVSTVRLGKVIDSEQTTGEVDSDGG